MKTRALLSSRALTLGLAALLLPAAHAAELTVPTLGALTLEASPTARVFALPALAPAITADLQANAPGRVSSVPDAAPAPNATLGPNLITNPGFETGNFTGYNVSMAVSGSNLSVSQNDPHAGRYAAQFSDTDKSYDILYQSLNTTPGASYTISFYLADSYNGVGGNGFKAEFGSTVLLNQVNSPTSGYTLYTYTATATDTFTNVFFEGYNASGFYALDDISVNAVVPEPGTWAGGALLLGAAGLILRRRRGA